MACKPRGESHEWRRREPDRWHVYMLLITAGGPKFRLKSPTHFLLAQKCSASMPVLVSDNLILPRFGGSLWSPLVMSETGFCQFRDSLYAKEWLNGSHFTEQKKYLKLAKKLTNKLTDSCRQKSIWTFVCCFLCNALGNSAPLLMSVAQQTVCVWGKPVYWIGTR